MKPQEIIDIATTATNTMQEGIDMLRALRLENDKLKSLLPKWRDIGEIDGVEDGTLMVLADFMRATIIDSKLIYFYKHNHKSEFYNKIYSHFLILPKL